MSKYTTELRFIIQQILDDKKLENVETNWYNSYQFIGLNDYPIFNENYRESLNNKIIRHYYTREIGAETIHRFRLFVRDAMFLIMPLYNQLYKSEIIANKMEPLGDRNIETIDHSWGKSSSESSSTSSSKNNSQNVFQDTPQNEMIPDQIRDLKYATTVNMDEDVNAASGDSKGSGDYDTMVDKKESGYSKPQSELLKLYRTTFLNIDNDIIHDKELSQCFMTIW